MEKAHLRRALVRAAVASCVGLFTLHPFTIVACVALCFWTLVPVTLLELWLAPKIQTKRAALGAGLACFLLAFGLLVAAVLECVYAQATLDSRSLGAGMAAAQTKLALWAQGGNHDEVIFVFYLAQSAALGCATAMLMRASSPRGSAVLLWIALVALVPTVDWLAYGVIRGRAEPSVAGLIVISSIFLAVGSAVATCALLVLGLSADRVDDRLGERARRHSPLE